MPGLQYPADREWVSSIHLSDYGGTLTQVQDIDPLLQKFSQDNEEAHPRNPVLRQGCTSTQRHTMPTEGSEVGHAMLSPAWRHSVTLSTGLAIILKPHHTKFNTRMKIVLTQYFYYATAPSFANSPTLIVLCTPPGTPNRQPCVSLTSGDKIRTPRDKCTPA